jgi:hypothetical protein
MVPADRAIVRLFHHWRQDCTFCFALLICHRQRFSSAGLHDNAFTFVVVVERGCAADHANLISFISCRTITVPSACGPTGELPPRASAPKEHAFKGAYGSDFGELKTDVCCSLSDDGELPPTKPRQPDRFPGDYDLVVSCN